jgi:thiol-disulfide isomerase/thioredoxin
MLIALAAAVVSSCGQPPQDSAGSGDSARTTAVSTSAPSISAPELKPVNREDLDRLIAEQRGNVVLVDFWATWCLPCLEQLPHTGQLAEKLGPRGLAVITVSLDSPTKLAQAAQTVVQRAGTAPQHLASALGGGSKAMEAFEIASGSAPHYKLYDRTGKLRQIFEVDPAAKRQFIPEDIDAAVEKLLAEP